MVTIIDAGRVVEADARIDDGGFRLRPEAMKSALGWELHDDLLCRDAMCVPVPAGTALADEDGIDLARLAAVLDRPLAVDLEERAAYLGVSARDRGQALASLLAPDFALSDLDGRLHALSEHRGKKVLLVVYASW
jgi:hypothetical protein